jgi:hypothetical protein
MPNASIVNRAFEHPSFRLLRDVKMGDHDEANSCYLVARNIRHRVIVRFHTGVRLQDGRPLWQLRRRALL